MADSIPRIPTRPVNDTTSDDSDTDSTVSYSSSTVSHSSSTSDSSNLSITAGSLGRRALAEALRMTGNMTENAPQKPLVSILRNNVSRSSAVDCSTTEQTGDIKVKFAPRAQFKVIQPRVQTLLAMLHTSSTTVTNVINTKKDLKKLPKEMLDVGEQLTELVRITDHNRAVDDKAIEMLTKGIEVATKILDTLDTEADERDQTEVLPLVNYGTLSRSERYKYRNSMLLRKNGVEPVRHSTQMKILLEKSIKNAEVRAKILLESIKDSDQSPSHAS